MRKQVFVSGLVGALVLFIWTAVVNGLLGFNASYSMKQIPKEREVYAALKATITEPGRYLCNPALTPDGKFPGNEPVFGIQYSGVGHDAAGLGEILGLVEFLILPLIGAWMLSKTSERYRSRLISRVGFFVSIGVLVAIAGDLRSFGIGGSPLNVALVFAAHTLVTWTIVGLAIASLMGPGRRVQSTA
jgi:hypothetical protein